MTTLQTAQHGEVDKAFIIYQIGLEGATRGGNSTRRIRQRGMDDEVEGGGSLRIDGADGDGQHILGHDMGIVQIL